MFNAKTEAKQLRAASKMRRKQPYQQSKLDRYKGELIGLRDHGATAAEMQRWLKGRRIKVAHSTVCRWLARNG